ncbi:MFS transporter [Kitasatospora herbaricolor]|uniref:MFS transporter n=1 Tax=Kitasatospora herbaricolor TaxID=68217 RepID=UPI00174C29EE|nr:MFS transporter [Kitasatospora herbaricolor]MDQ0307193.1 MFS family permease [Kitasatospora herbaricolor]GGV31171.1 MFS transporter [Kitasatospora herbaricolor]
MKALLPAVLREEPQFARLFAGQSLSVLGDRVSFVAVPFAVLAVGGSASDVGLVAAAALVPMLLFTLVGGVWADRFHRHRIMLASDLARFAVQGTAAVLLLAGAAGVPELALLMLLFGTADAFFMPASTGLLPLVVAPERLREANALRGLVQSAGLVVGPAVAGVLVALAGPGGALAFDALTFAASAAFLLRLRPREKAAPGGAGGTFLGELRAGWAQVRSRTWVWSGMAAMAVYHVVVLPSVFVLGPVIADHEWGGAASWSLVTAAFGLGAVVGDVCAYRLKPARPMALAAAALAVASCQALIIGSGGPVLLIAALEAVTGVGVSLFFVLWETSLQTHVPEDSLSRVSSYDHLLSAGLMPLGLVLAGPVSAALGLRPTLYAMTVLGVPAALALLCLPSVRQLPADRPVADDSGAPPAAHLPALADGAVHDRGHDVPA